MMKSPPRDNSVPAESVKKAPAKSQVEQTLRYARDLRVIMDSHEKLQADYQQLAGKKDRLLDRNAAFKQLLQDNRNLYLSTDRWGRIIHANPAAVAYLNMAIPQGESILRLLPEGLVRTGNLLQVEIEDQRSEPLVTLKGMAGEEREFTLRVIYGQEERPDRAVIHWLFFPQGRDEGDLSWTLATTVFNSAGEGILVLDGQGLILTANPALCAMTGRPVQDLVGRPPEDIIVPSDNGESFGEIWQSLLDAGQWQGRVHLRHREGELTQGWLALSLSLDGERRINSCIGLLSDMEPLLKVERYLEYAANYDALTNLPNRSLLLNRLDNALALARRQGESISLLFIDLDGFKNANDRNGHDFGDFVLQEVARRLGGLVRESDTLARYGGDEFVLIMHGMEVTQDVEVFVAKLLETSNRVMRYRGKEARIGFSIGCAQYPRHADDAASLLQMADAAMYLAKSAGGHQLQMFQAFACSHESGPQAVCDIKVAFERDRLKLVYQPQFDITQNPPRLLGVEALLRCRASPGEAPARPEMLLQSAARNGLTSHLTQWVLETACHQLQSWREKGLEELRLSINLSASQMRDQGLARQIQSVLESLRLGGKSVVFDAPLNIDVREFESLFQVEGGREQFKLLRRLGVSLTVEDSLRQAVSLSDLSEKMPLSRLKVGADSVARLGLDSRVDAQCRAVAAVARAFGLQVGAVGIETLDQLSLLNAMGYGFGQGFLLGKPMEAKEFWSWGQGAAFGRRT